MPIPVYPVWRGRRPDADGPPAHAQGVAEGGVPEVEGIWKRSLLYVGRGARMDKGLMYTHVALVRTASPRVVWQPAPVCLERAVARAAGVQPRSRTLPACPRRVDAAEAWMSRVRRVIVRVCLVRVVPMMRGWQ